jgi:DNA binding domain, excisionase family
MADKKEAVFSDDTDRLLSIEEAAARLRTSRAFVSNLINTGMLPALKFGTNRRIRKVAFNAFLEKNDGCDLPAMLATQKNTVNGR